MVQFFYLEIGNQRVIQATFYHGKTFHSNWEIHFNAYLNHSLTGKAVDNSQICVCQHELSCTLQNSAGYWAQMVQWLILPVQLPPGVHEVAQIIILSSPSTHQQYEFATNTYASLLSWGGKKGTNIYVHNGSFCGMPLMIDR